MIKRRIRAAAAAASLGVALGAAVSTASEATTQPSTDHGASPRAAAAPDVSPRRPVPRETITFAGQLGKGERPVALQRRVGEEWEEVATGRTHDGAYTLRTLALSRVRTYRVVLPAVDDLPRQESESRVVRRLTGKLFWHWDGLCRGSSDPDVYKKYCRLRDSAIRRGGWVVSRDFNTAWRRKDGDWMRRLLENDWAMDMVGDSRAVSKRPDCAYDDSEPEWYCWTKVEDPQGDRSWMGYPVRITVYEGGRLPVWRVIGVAPDA